MRHLQLVHWYLKLTKFWVILWCFYLSFCTGSTKWNAAAINILLLFLAGLFTGLWLRNAPHNKNKSGIIVFKNKLLLVTWITSLLFDLNYKLITRSSYAFSPGEIYILYCIVLYILYILSIYCAWEYLPFDWSHRGMFCTDSNDRAHDAIGDLTLAVSWCIQQSFIFCYGDITRLCLHYGRFSLIRNEFSTF